MRIKAKTITATYIIASFFAVLFVFSGIISIHPAQAAGPTVNFTINGSTGPIYYGYSNSAVNVTLAWSSSGATTCESSGSGDSSWGYSVGLATSGSKNFYLGISQGNNEWHFVITCYDANGQSTSKAILVANGGQNAGMCDVFPELVGAGADLTVTNLTTGDSSSASASGGTYNQAQGPDLPAAIGDKLLVEYHLSSGGDQGSYHLYSSNAIRDPLYNTSANLDGATNGQFIVDSVSVLGSFEAAVNDCGNGQAFADINLTQRTPADFSAACSPVTATITQGSSTSFNISTTALNGFNSAITWSSSFSPSTGTLPTVAYTNNGVAPPATTTANISTNGSTTAGTYTITFTGTGGGQTHTCSVNLTVNVPVSASISVSPSSIMAGQSATISWTPTGTTAGTNCTASGSWTGAQGSNPGQTYTASTGTINSTGSYTYTIQCTGPAGTSSPVSAILSVQDFTISCSPTAVNNPPGSTFNISLSTTAVNGYSTAIALSSSASPTPAVAPSISYSPSSNNTPGSTTTAVFTVPANATTGTYNYTFSGTSGGISHTCGVQVGINPTPTVTISVSPSTMMIGQTATITWTVANATSGTNCIASNSWSGNKTSTTGTYSETVTPTSEGYYYYNIQCSGPGGTSNLASAQLTVENWYIDCLQFALTVNQGGTTSKGLGLEGRPDYTGAVTFTQSVSPAAAVPVTFSYSPSNVYNANPSGYGPNAVISAPANATPGTYTITFTGTSDGLTRTCSVQLTVNPTPTVTISITPSSIAMFDSATINWTPTNTSSGTACTAGGNWSGAKSSTPGTTYSESTGAMMNPGTYSYTIYCTGPGGTSSIVSADLTVNYPDATGNITCNGNSVSCTISYGSSATIAWSTSFANYCFVANGSTTLGVGTSGSKSTGALTAPTQTYELWCYWNQNQNYGKIASVTVNVTGDFSLNCTPVTSSVAAGSSTSYQLAVSYTGGFTGTVTFSTPSLTPDNGANNPTNTFVPSSSKAYSDTDISSVISTSATTTPASPYSITFTGTSGVRSHTCTVSFYVSSTPPTAPLNVKVSNANCGTIDVTWSAGDGSDGGSMPDTQYNIYRRTSGTGTYTDSWNLAGTVSTGDANPPRGVQPTQTAFTDNSPFLPTGSNYYAVAAVDNNGVESAKVEPTTTPIVPQVCAANMSPSDMDLASVQGHLNQNFTEKDCSGTSEIADLPNNTLFSPGDTVTLKLNICNSGSLDMTNVSAHITFDNLTNPQWLSASPSGCVTKQDIGTNTMDFWLQDISKKTNGNISYCSITYTATITAPQTHTSDYSRFQSIADIYSDTVNGRVFIPPYLFGLSGSVPNRNEVAPE